MHRSDFSRRTVINGLAVTPVFPAVINSGNNSDPELIALGRDLLSLLNTLENSGGIQEAAYILTEIEVLTEKIVATPATSVDGLRVKARATAWAIEQEFGLLDPSSERSPNERLAASIVRDLLKNS